jgi:large subunit ribosomal protein L17
MRHRLNNKHFNRDSKGRKAMFKSLLAALFQHGAIETTHPKARVIKTLADKIIGKALPGTLTARRLLERFFGSKQVVNRVVDGVAPAMQGRRSGFTRIIPLGRRRGDDAEMVKLELVAKPLPPKEEVKPVVAKPVKTAPVAAKAPKAPKAVKAVKAAPAKKAKQK